MQLKERVGESWKCIECGVVYAPFVTECRCSVTVATNEMYLTCVHEWPEPYAPCTKCGMTMGGVTFEVSAPTVDIVGCQHSGHKLNINAPNCDEGGTPNG